MSDSSISIVPKKSNYHNTEEKANEILQWLISKDIVKPILSDCTLSSNLGYAVSDGAKLVAVFPSDLPFGMITCGMEITLQRKLFHAGEYGLDSVICPKCKEDIFDLVWNLSDWNDGKSDNMLCPNCNTESEVNEFTFDPTWGFSNLGFTFWNWPDFTNEFLNEFKEKLNCDIYVVEERV